MKWFYNLKISAKLISVFILVSLITAIVGGVGYYYLNDLGNQKLQAIKSLLEIEQAYTNITALDNLILSPNVTIEDKKGYYITISEVSDEFEQLKSSYEKLNRDSNEEKLWNTTKEKLNTYMAGHDVLINKSKTIDSYSIENPSALRYIIASREKDHYRWIWLLEDSMITGTTFSGQLDGSKCALGKWLGEYNTQSTELIDSMNEIDKYHLNVHASGEKINAIIEGNGENKLSRAYKVYETETLSNMNRVLEILATMDVAAEKSENIYKEMTHQALDINLGNQEAAALSLEKLVDYTSKSVEKSVVNANSIIIILTGIGVLLSIVCGIFISRIIKKPIAMILEAANKIADGFLDVEIDIDTKDETGALANAFRTMTDNINEVMTNINVASDQVASGSRQVSDSSMSLSQGATEQASSIEELTASIEQIASQTRLNADNAEKAKAMAMTAQEFAQEGNNHMTDMVEAMTEIDESSNKISKVIKVIDDIAFQTNILALNAAVEAARAGQHGKGFAVVAEEVRNLAARSASAAKETTEMIEGSINKVEGGTRIANQTAEALKKIVEGVSSATDLVGDIAVASKEQAIGVDQINQGIIQISDVVQTTSATAEQSAASSEELSSQAELLKSQVATFKLKRNSNSRDYDHGSLDPDVMKILNEMKDNNRSMDASGPSRISLSDSEFEKY